MDLIGKTRLLPPILGALLLFGEIGIASLAEFRPHVHENYTSYYINGTRSCWLPESSVAHAVDVLTTDEIDLVRLDRAGSCFLLAGGWSNIEAWGVWSLGRSAKLDVPVRPGRTKLTMTAIGYARSGTQFVDVGINGIPTGRFAVPERQTELAFNVPPGALGTLRIALRIESPTTPLRGQDSREIGLGLISLRWN